MPGFRIWCSITITGEFEGDRIETRDRIHDGLRTASALSDVQIEPMSPRDSTRVVAFNATASGPLSGRHVDAISEICKLATLPPEGYQRPVRAAIAALRFEALPVVAP